MVETLAPNTTPYPEFKGDLGQWEEGLRVVDGILQHPEGYEFDAKLSEIIGYMPVEEMVALGDAVGLTVRSGRIFAKRIPPGEPSYRSLSELEDFMPTTLATINADISLVTENQAELDTIGVLRAFVEAGHSPQDDEVHIDTHSLESRLPWYLISDIFPTISYKGPVRVYKDIDEKYEREIDKTSLDPEAVAAMPAAPRLAIVRMFPAAPHASQIFTESTTRTMVRALAKRIPPAH